MKKVLTIAGSDCSGGAGIQADLKTMSAYGVYGMSAITALTAQNTTGVYGVEESMPDFLRLQLDCIFQDIFPDAVKIGMVSSVELIGVISDKLKEFQARHVVLDPVMVSTSGSRLLNEGASKALAERLIPLAEVITPNIPEAEVLTGIHIEKKCHMEQAARQLGERFGVSVLVKGGHNIEDADDVLYDRGVMIWFPGNRVDNHNTHGTGCTLSSAIASGLALNLTLKESIKAAKGYLTNALESGLGIGKGSGPLNHCVKPDLKQP